MVNPMQILQARQVLEQNHPKAAAFVSKMMSEGITEGTILELTVTKPGGEPVTANVRVTASDLEAIKNLGF